MVPDVFLDQYRISKAADGIPVEMSRNGPAITYKASDAKSGAPVALTVVPTLSVDPAEREQFEQKARTTMLLDHVNITKTVAFGTTDDSLIFVSEYPLGESVEAWVKVHGPMPPDAVIRVALQVVSALGAASFHGLTHPAIQPGNLVIVTGKTAEDGWPLVKLTHFALSGLKSAPGHSEPDVGASDYASPEQLLQGKVDFRSEMYSLGATMCFLLTGVFYSAYPRSPQTKRFRGPLRKLIARMLEDEPELRPNDPVQFTDELRSCLAAVERRQRLHHQYGVPLAAIVKKPKRAGRFRRLRPVPLLASIGRKPAATVEPKPAVTRPVRRLSPGWIIAACLLAAGFAAALFLPEDIVTAAFRRDKTPETIGVPIGVPESSPAAVVTSQSAASPSTSRTSSAAPARETTNAVMAQTANSLNSATPSGPATVAAAPSAPPNVVEKSSPAPTSVVVLPQQASAGVVAQNAGSDATMNSPAESIQSPATIAHVETKSSAVPSTAAAPTAAPEVALAESVPPQPAPTAAPVVANNVISKEPAPPAEPPDSSSETPVTETTEPGPANASASSAAANDDNDSRLTDNNPAPIPTTRAPKPRTKKPTVAKSRSISRQRVPRALPVEPDNAPRSGTFHARVVGITPNGNVILALPNGERAIVAPQDAEQYSRGTNRRPRRVIIERRVVTPPPYQPFLPPGT